MHLNICGDVDDGQPVELDALQSTGAEVNVGDDGLAVLSHTFHIGIEETL